MRAAWRRIAAATHPDREDGGDPARFGAAAAAYVMLRTGFGRGEALADLGLGRGDGSPWTARAPARTVGGPVCPGGRPTPRASRGTGRPADGGAPARADAASALDDTARASRRLGGCGRGGRVRRPGGLALRVTGVAVLALVAVLISGWSPASSACWPGCSPGCSAAAGTRSRGVGLSGRSDARPRRPIPGSNRRCCRIPARGNGRPRHRPAAAELPGSGRVPSLGCSAAIGRATIGRAGPGGDA